MCIRWDTLFVVVFSLLIVILQNASTHDDTFVSVSSSANEVQIGYGWPLSAVQGAIDKNSLMQSTFPPQFWRSTTSVRFIPSGAAVDTLVLIVLCMSSYRFSLYLRSHAQFRFTIQALFGILMFVALIVFVRVRSWRAFLSFDPNYPLLDATDMFFTYVENTAWFLVFIACLYAPGILVTILVAGRMLFKNVVTETTPSESEK